MSLKQRFLCLFIGTLTSYCIASIGPWIWKIKWKQSLHILDLYYAWKEVSIFHMPQEILVSSIGGTLITLSALAIIFKHKKNHYGTARWARSAEYKQFGLNTKDGIILGKSNSNKYIKTNHPLSVLVLAPPGTGKSSGIIIPTLLTLKNSCVVHDIKGELFDTTSHHRSTFSDVYLFDPTSSKTCQFNVLAKEMLPSHPDDCHRYVSNLATLLIKHDHGKQKDDFFVRNTRQLFIFLAEYLICKHGETSISNIFDLFLSNEQKDLLIRGLMQDEDCPDTVRKVGDGVLTNAVAPNQWAAITSTLNIALEVYRDSRIAAATSGSCSFVGKDLRKAKRPISVYLKVREKDKESIAPLISMFFEAIGHQLLSETPKSSDQNVTFVLDEFVRLGKHDTLKNLPALSRSYKLNCLFAAQDVEQISEIYGKESVPIFETNCDYKIILRQNSYNTADRISKLIGNKTVKKHSYSAEIHKTGKGNITLSYEGIPLLSIQEILGMDADDCIIIVGGHANRPIKAKIASWYKDPKLRKLVQYKQIIKTSQGYTKTENQWHKNKKGSLYNPAHGMTIYKAGSEWNLVKDGKHEKAGFTSEEAKTKAHDILLK